MGALLMIVSALMAQAPQTVAPPAAPIVPMQIDVAVRSYRPDGTSGGMASGQFFSGESATLWIDPVGCGMGAATGVRPPELSANATIWLSSGRIVATGADEFAVELTLKRWNSGEWQQTTKSFQVKRGETVVLEDLPGASVSCEGRSMKLEASVVPAMSAGVPTAGGRGGARAAPRSALATGRSSGAGGRMVVDPSPATFLDNEFAHLGESPTEHSFVASGLTTGGPPTPVELHSVRGAYRAEVWLVHTAPDGTQRTDSRVGRIDDGGGTFRFNPVTIQLSNGPTFAVLAINLRPMTTENGTPVLRAVTARAVQGVSQGASSRAVPLPSGGEVVAFELPPLDAILAGHRFEVRVRLTPAG